MGHSTYSARPKARAVARERMQLMRNALDRMLVEVELETENIDRGKVKEHLGYLESAAYDLAKADILIRQARGEVFHVAAEN